MLADMQMWAQTSVLRWQHPIFRNTEPHRHRASWLTEECGWKQGVSAAKVDPGEEHVH